MDATNRTVAGWVLEERLGSGGFGEVWRARRRHVDVVRALKLVPVTSESAFASWRHEIDRLETLSHPNIVRFYDADLVEEDGRYQDYAWIATELCERSLADELDRRETHVLTGPECADLTVAMLGALAAAHEQGFVHRDIKPANILLHRSGTWKLCDFGTARLVPDGELAPHTGVVGTFPYMSPAAHRGQQDQAADLYALGVTVHEALCGSLLHPRAPGTTDSEYIKAILDTPPVISSRLEGPWHALVAALIGSHGRQTADQVLARFGPQLGATTGRGLAPTEVVELPRTVASTATTTQPTRRPEPTRHQSRPPRARAGSSDGRHVVAILTLIGVSLVVSGLLLAQMIGNPVAVVAILGVALVLVVGAIALS